VTADTSVGDDPPLNTCTSCFSVGLMLVEAVG